MKLDSVSVAKASLLFSTGGVLLLAFSHFAYGVYSDKLTHFCAFLFLGVLATWAFPNLGWVQRGLALSALGGLIELLQAMPAISRDADVWDWFADNVGVFCALVVSWTSQSIATKRGRS